MTRALKKDVHAPADEHICSPAPAPVYLCVFAEVDRAQVCGCKSEGFEVWRQRKNTIRRRLLQKPDGEDKQDTVKGKRKASQRENQSKVIKDVKVEEDKFVCLPKLFTAEPTYTDV